VLLYIAEGDVGKFAREPDTKPQMFERGFSRKKKPPGEGREYKNGHSRERFDRGFGRGGKEPNTQ